MAEPVVTEGKAGAEPEGITASATDGQTPGESKTPEQKTDSGTGQAGGNGESFYDYESIKDDPKLVGIYKEMQRGLTRKSEEVSKGRD